MLRAHALMKKRDAKNALLKSLRAKRKKLADDEAKLKRDVDAADDPSDELMKAVDENTDAITEVDDQIAAVLDELEDIETQLDSIEDATGAEDPAEDPADDTASRGRPAPETRARRAAPAAVESRGFNCRSRCFASRSQRDAFYAQPEVKDFLGRVRSMLGGNQKPGAKRSVTGAELGIPEQIMEVLRDNADQYSKLLRFVRLRQVRGTARQPIIGEVPEGIWMEMKGALNEITFAVHEVEMDGFKVGGVIIEDNYLLEDVSDIALGEEILYMLGQAVFLAVDKAIPYGKGKAQKMPLGFVTRLAQTQEPADWGEKRRAWKDLHSSNILKLNLLSATGADFFTPLLGALAKAKTRYTNGERVWIMNEATKIDILIKSLGIDSAAAIVAGMNNTMPIIGGQIVTEEFMPDFNIAGGSMQAYTVAERQGGKFGYSDLPLYIEDKTVFKGTARYDGTPVIDEDFVLVSYNNVDPVISLDFAIDAAGDGLNALIVTAAAGTAVGDTALTIAGSVAASPVLRYKVGVIENGLWAGQQIDKTWSVLPANANVTAAAGATVTVVELDADGKLLSFGTVASVPKT